MYRMLMMAMLVAAVGCEQKNRSSSRETQIQPIIAASAARTSSPKEHRPIAPKKSVEQLLYESEEERLASLRVEFALLSRRDQEFVKKLRVWLAKRPIDLSLPDVSSMERGDSGMMRLQRFLNTVDVDAYYIAWGEEHGSEELAKELRLEGQAKQRFKLRFGMMRDPIVMIGAKRCIEEILATGFGKASDGLRASIRDYGLAEFLVNVKD